MTYKSIVTGAALFATATFGITSQVQARDAGDNMLGLLIFGAIAAAIVDDAKDNDKRAPVETHRTPKHDTHVSRARTRTAHTHRHTGRIITKGVHHRHGRTGYHYHAPQRSPIHSHGGRKHSH